MEKLNWKEYIKIIEIIKIELNDVLLEIRFKVQIDKEFGFFSCGINHDGESIFFLEGEKVNEQTYTDSIYTKTLISIDSDDKLTTFLNSTIKKVSFGVGNSLEIIERKLYYLKISTDRNEFIFFNNGDNGYYSFDNIERILLNDIYGYEWEDNWN